MTPRDELLAEMLDAQNEHGSIESMLDVVLAAGERRWLCGRDDGNCGPDLVADYPGVHNAARGCHDYVVLPVSLREGEPSNG